MGSELELTIFWPKAVQDVKSELKKARAGSVSQF
jgi:hypothetical protein